MGRSTINPSKKSRRGRPPVDSEQVNVRLQRPLLHALDLYKESECPKGTSRPEALRRAFADWAVSMGLLPPPSRAGEAPKPAKAPKPPAPEKPAPELQESAEPPVSDEEWWTGLSEAERSEILETEGIKRSPKFPWRRLGRTIQGRLGAVRGRAK